MGTNEKRGTNHLRRDLMLFWGTHATGRFNESTIGYALDSSDKDVKRELESLVEIGIVERESDNGATLYRLTKKEPRRSCIIEAARPGHSLR